MSTTPESTCTDIAVKLDSLRVVIERHPNPAATTFHLNHRLVERKYGLMFDFENGALVRDTLFGSDKEDEDLAPWLLELATKLCKTDGVTREFTSTVAIDDYKIRIGKAVAFTDDEVEGAVLTVLAETFSLKRSALVVTIDDQRSRPPLRLDDEEEDEEVEDPED